MKISNVQFCPLQHAATHCSMLQALTVLDQNTKQITSSDLWPLALIPSDQINNNLFKFFLETDIKIAPVVTLSILSLHRSCHFTFYIVLIFHTALVTGAGCTWPGWGQGRVINSLLSVSVLLIAMMPLYRKYLSRWPWAGAVIMPPHTRQLIQDIFPLALCGQCQRGASDVHFVLQWSDHWCVIEWPRTSGDHSIGPGISKHTLYISTADISPLSSRVTTQQKSLKSPK